ncbi:MAG: hypothetical protein K2Q18_15565 [Bdellovibrionales bacterium]|nr:hypothetical protein [Bdellovibrionales bacterium]
MKHIKKHARFVLVSCSLLFILALVSCKPGSEVASAEETGIGQIREGQYIDQIRSIASQSSCASYSWKGRGKAPSGYIQGMALTYARSYCRLKTNDSSPKTLVSILSGAAGSSTTDALGLYISTFSNLAMDVTSAGGDNLRYLYTLGTGLGMRESSGKYCEGRDMSSSNTTALTAEAGMFQTSYDSMTATSDLSKLYAEYLADTSKCFLDIFKLGISCSASDLSVAGTGAGATYQAFNKSCPAFAAEYAMVMLRVRRNHYGPINRKEAEVTTTCNQMLAKVESVIDSDIYACDEII